MFKQLSLGMGILAVAGCTSYGAVVNDPLLKADASTESYSIKDYSHRRDDSGDISLILAFSGGGTRAAALAYGVLLEMRDTVVKIDGRPRRLIDEIDAISSVSGGSFTAAYYGLYGDRLFEDFEDVFLRRNVQGALLEGLFNPLEWFRSTGRTEMAVKYYEREVFQGATYNDMRRDGPLIVINASDLGAGARFSFLQEYFNLLCSDIDSFPVARAVTASSAVPVLFNPVVVRNYDDCKAETPAWLIAAEARAVDNPELAQVVEGIKSYFKKENREYAHYVDGGITDNLGLRAVYEVIEVSGGAKAFTSKIGRPAPRSLAVIGINAATQPDLEMDASAKQPSPSEVISAVTDVQLHRYNAATLELMEHSVKRWAAEMSAPGRPVKPYLMHLSLQTLQEEERNFLNLIPTSFSLSDEQVDRLIEAGRELVRNHPEFRAFLEDLASN